MKKYGENLIVWDMVDLTEKFERITQKNNVKNQNVLTVSAQLGLIKQDDFFNKIVASDIKDNYFLLKRGDFAYNKSYSNGYPYGAIKVLDKYEMGVVSPLYICFRPKSSNICPKFYEYYFELGLLNREINRIAQEGARNHGILNITTIDFLNVKIPDVDLLEQQKIVKIIELWDKAIKIKEKLLYNQTRFFDALLSNVMKQENAEFKKIKDIAKIVNGYAFQSTDYSDDGKYEVVTISNVQKNKFLIEKTNKINKIPNNFSKDQLINKDDILISMTGNVGRVCRSTKDGLLLNQRVGKIIPNENIVLPAYFFFNLNMTKFIKRMEFLSQGGAQSNLSTRDIYDFEVHLPSIDIQIKITEFISKYDSLISLLEEELKYLKIQKKGLMQNLLTGLIRVNTNE